MSSNRKKEPVEILKDKLRLIFSPKDPQKIKSPLPSKARLSIWYFLIAFFLFFYFQQNFFSSKVETIPYSQFKQYLSEGTLDKLIIGPENIRGTLTGKGELPGQNQEFTTVRVNDPDLVKDLDEQKVSYSGHYDNKFLSSILSWIIFMGIFFLIWRYVIKRMAPGMGVMSFSKSKAKIFAESETKVTFSDVAGIDEAKEELQEVVEFLSNPEKFQKHGEGFQKGCFWLARLVPAKPFLPGPWPGRRKSLSSASVVPSLWRCS